MTSKETFTHYQPLGNSDPAHTATAPGGLSAKAPAMTPLMLDTSTRKLVAWDGTTDGAAVGILAVAADQTSTTLTFYKSGTFRYEDVLWPEAASDEAKKRTAFAHAHTVGIGAHTHSVAIGSHGHTITVNAAGNAENTVKNIAFNYIVRLA